MPDRGNTDEVRSAMVPKTWGWLTSDSRKRKETGESSRDAQEVDATHCGRQRKGGSDASQPQILQPGQSVQGARNFDGSLSKGLECPQGGILDAG